ncbi:50S ribosomal protein L20 [bacterium]|nr:50S ribosomal protein L20 [bacterium]
MTRVKRGKIKHKKREKILKQTKGFHFGRQRKKKLAKEALIRSLRNAFIGRKLKKRDFRRLWQVKINALSRKFELSYSKFINLLKKENIKLDRKILAEIAQDKPEIFEKIIKEIKK